MAFFRPTLYLESVLSISPELLKKLKVGGLLLDIDNTLTEHGAPKVSKEVAKWLQELKDAGISLVLISNNHKPRVQAFAKHTGLPYVFKARKPLPMGFSKALEILNLPKNKVLIVGDQVFSDILGANLLGMRSALVERLSPDEPFLIRVKRVFEMPFRTVVTKKHP